jgi:hypothetical protein
MIDITRTLMVVNLYNKFTIDLVKQGLLNLHDKSCMTCISKDTIIQGGKTQRQILESGSMLIVRYLIDYFLLH